MENIRQHLKKILEENFGTDTSLQDIKNASGGCINHAASLITNKGSFFVKWGQAQQMYHAESAGLKLLAGKSKLKLPDVIDVGVDSFAYILMERVQTGPASDAFWYNLGEGLAQLHSHTETQHGLSRNNFIGSLDQENGYHDTWTEFFIESRLEVQLELAVQNRLIDTPFVQKFRKIYSQLRTMIPEDKPSLLHGDLWSGNILPAANGAASIIDPAVYYGSREVEIAFTHLFGGFDRKFYQAYENNLPLDKGFKERISIYNLYPLLVHANMFGVSYLRPVEEVVRKFL